MKTIIEVSVTTDTIAAWRVLEQFEQTHFENPGQPFSKLLGASVIFTGKMRNHNEGQSVTGMTLDHYPGMTEKVIQEQIQTTLQTYPVAACLVQHRVGEVLPGETLVVCACWSAHRHQAFRACEEIFEGLKSTAPFWKQETLASGEMRWVAANTKTNY